MKFLTPLCLSLCFIFSSVDAREPKYLLENSGLKVEVLQNEEPKLFKTKHGYSHVVLDKSSQSILRLTNETDERLNVILTLNHLNPMTGQTAILKDNGFVLQPNQSINIINGFVDKKDKKQQKTVELFQHFTEGFFNFSVFKERKDYPLLTQYMEPPPHGPEHFVTDADGTYRWVAPKRYPFRRIQNTPNAQIYATFNVEDYSQ